jgi:predicted transcriptional regulator of viral defense system
MKNFDKLTDIFHATEAYAVGVTPADLKEATDDGELERRMRGVYKKTDAEDLGEWTNYEVLAKGLKGRFAICLLSALSHYGLTDQILEESWVMIDNNCTIHHNGVRFFRSRKPMWDIGIVVVEGIPFTSLERTLVECLVHKKRVSFNEAHSALIKALRGKKIKPWDITRVAEQMGHTQKIAKYLEPFIYAG